MVLEPTRPFYHRILNLDHADISTLVLDNLRRAARYPLCRQLEPPTDPRSPRTGSAGRRAASNTVAGRPGRVYSIDWNLSPIESEQDMRTRIASMVLLIGLMAQLSPWTPVARAADPSPGTSPGTGQNNDPPDQAP